MKRLITLIFICLLYSTNSMAQQHAVGIHIGGMTLYSFGTGFNYMYINKMHQIGAAVGVGEYGIIDNDNTEDAGSHSFGHARIFYNRILGKDPIGFYLGGGAQWLSISQKPLQNINALLGETHVGVSFTIGNRLRVNLEQAFAVGPSWGPQEGRTEFGKEIKNTTQVGSYYPFTINIYYLLGKK